MDGVNRIYWLNLDRCVDRRVNMEKMLSDPCFDNITKTRISSVDGINDNIYNYLIIDEKKSIDVQYACLISHFNAMHHFSIVGEPGEIALIFEDDMTLDLKKYWTKTIREIAKDAPSDWDIIQLSYIVHNIPSRTYEAILYNNSNALYGIGAYIMKYESAKRFIEMMYNSIIEKYTFLKSREPSFVYHISDHYIYSFNKGYCYRYPYFIYAYDQASTVNTSHMDFHNRSRAQKEKFLEYEIETKNIEKKIWNGAIISSFFAGFGILLWGVFRNQKRT